MGQACSLPSSSELESVTQTAVIVLGFSCDHGSGLPSDPLKHRLEHAAEVAKRVSASTIVCSGGIDHRHDQLLPTEADIMARYLESLPDVQENRADGSPRFAILRERRSTSTRENALFSFELLAKEVRRAVA